MKIDELELVVDPQWQTLSARVNWENSQHAPQRIYFRAPSSSLSMVKHINPFIIAAAVPAMAAGETRIATDYPVDPILIEGLPSALAIIQYWCRDIAAGWTLPDIAAPIQALNAAQGRQTASFYSGGVDATFTMLRNHDLIPYGNAGRIQYAFIVYGLDLGFTVDLDERQAIETFLSNAAPDLKARDVIPVYIESNLRQLDPRKGFWGRAFNGFALSALAQLFPESIDQVLIGTTGERLSDSVQLPWGSHPILHGYLNSSAVHSRSPHVEYSRLQRLKLITCDSKARKNLRVCFKSNAKELNCGVCEKCVRTRLGLLLTNSDPNQGFGGPPLSPELIATYDISSPTGMMEHEELFEGLKLQGHWQLATAEEALLKRYRRFEDWRLDRGWKGWIKRRGKEFLILSNVQKSV